MLLLCLLAQFLPNSVVMLAVSQLTAQMQALADSASMEHASTDVPLMIQTHSRLLLAVMLAKKALTVLMLVLADFALTELASIDVLPTRLLTKLTSWEPLAEMPAKSQLTVPMPVPAASVLMAPASTDVPLTRSRASPNSLPS